MGERHRWEGEGREGRDERHRPGAGEAEGAGTSRAGNRKMFTEPKKRGPRKVPHAASFS